MREMTVWTLTFSIFGCPTIGQQRVPKSTHIEDQSQASGLGVGASSGRHSWSCSGTFQGHGMWPEELNDLDVPKEPFCFSSYELVRVYWISNIDMCKVGLC